MERFSCWGKTLCEFSGIANFLFFDRIRILKENFEYVSSNSSENFNRDLIESVWKLQGKLLITVLNSRRLIRHLPSARQFRGSRWLQWTKMVRNRLTNSNPRYASLLVHHFPPSFVRIICFNQWDPSIFLSSSCSQSLCLSISIMSPLGPYFPSTSRIKPTWIDRQNCVRQGRRFCARLRGIVWNLWGNFSYNLLWSTKLRRK